LHRQVFEDEDGGHVRPHFAHENRCDLIRLLAALDHAVELTAGALADVDKNHEGDAA
jgi:hypothetical protein